MVTFHAMKSFLAVQMRKAAFLSFIFPPIIMLIFMNSLMEWFIYDIGEISSTNALLAERYNVLELGNVALSEGRFKFMTFFQLACVIYPALIIFSLKFIWSNLTKIGATSITILAVVPSAFWVNTSLLRVDAPVSTQLLFSITNDIALAQYDDSFAYAALLGAKVHFGLALFATLLAVIAGSCIMKGLLSEVILAYKDVAKKRRDLKLLLMISSAFLTFVAVYVSEWVAWGANFVTSVDPESTEPITGTADEILMLARGIRLYYGVGYSAILVAFAGPAIIVFSRYVERNNYKELQDQELVLNQRVFTREEIGIIIPILAPLLMPLLANAIGV